MNNNLPLISIIIPVFNEEKTVLEFLKRIKEVVAKDILYEVIIINDGSTDSTLEILENE